MSSPAGESFIGDDVYLGVWTNWSHGRVHGATLTLSRQNGGLLIAFLALFVGAAGTSLWKIGCFLLHRCFSSKRAADALYHQRQAILRNASNSQSGLVILLHTCWAWRNFASFWRLLPPISFAVLTFISFIIAGIFSSAVATSMGQEVLLKSPNCGDWNVDFSDWAKWISVQPYVSKTVASSLNYAQRCYLKNANPRDCAVYFQSRLQWKTDKNATCPFPDKEICLKDSGNLRLDSDYIDSDHHLGINSSPETRFLFRTVVECAPLRTRGHTRNIKYTLTKNATGNRNQDEVTQTSHILTEYFYGYYLGSKWNSTLQRRAEIPGTVPSSEDYASDYSLQSVSASVDITSGLVRTGDFGPIRALWGNNSDVTCIFLSMNSITFPEPCHDPWYAATTLMDAAAAIIDVIIPSEALANTTGGYYVRDEPARVLGCTSQYQYCNPISKSGKSGKPGKSCTPLAGWYQATAASFALWSNDGQRNLFNASLQKILGHGSSIDDIVKSANIASLKAREKLQGGLQGPLPDNQWQLEVENWYGGSLAVLQGAPVNYATGPIEPALLQILNRPQTESERRLCDSVKIRSDVVTSFSILGLGILCGLCGLLIIVSITIESLTEWMSKKFGRGTYQQLEWVSNDTLQLQRLAHEELGCGTWAGGRFPITTTAGETLAMLDISEPDHPRLVNPTLANTSVTMQNVCSPLMDTSLPLEDISSPLRVTSSPTEYPSSPMGNASSPTIDASSPLMEASPSASLKHTSSRESSNATTVA